MAWLPAVGFLALFAAVHWHEPGLLDRPLSELRDGPRAAAGYALFALLVAAGVGQTRERYRAGGGRAAFVPGLAVGLLVFVALSPTYDIRHGLASGLLLAAAFAHFARELHLAGSLWLWPHLLVLPAVGAAAADGWTYGRIQKGLIVYLLLAATAD